MADITAELTTREVVKRTEEGTITIELSVEDAEQVFNFIEYATRTDAKWRGYATYAYGTPLSTAGGRKQTEDLARAIGRVTNQHMGTTQHAE